MLSSASVGDGDRGLFYRRRHPWNPRLLRGGVGAERGSQGGGKSLRTRRESRYEWTSHAAVKLAAASDWVTGRGEMRSAAGDFHLVLHMFIFHAKNTKIENLFLQEVVGVVWLCIKRTSCFHLSSDFKPSKLFCGHYITMTVLLTISSGQTNQKYPH